MNKSTRGNSHRERSQQRSHSSKPEEVLEALKTSPEKGLSQKEVRRRIEKYGPNTLMEHQQKSLFQIALEQIANPIVYLLVAATILAFLFGDIPEGIAIIVVLVLNTIIGFWMEFQARQSMNALQEMDKVTANVIREGEKQAIEAEQLVPGDIIYLESGDLVPADGRIIELAELSIDEAALTGESNPVTKKTGPVDSDTPVADRHDMVFKGTAVARGKGRAIIVTTGMETEIGSISEMVSEAEEEQIPLNRKLEQLSKNLIWATMGLAAVFFGIGWIAGEEVYQLVQTSIAWTIAAIPEGLPIVASIALARGMLRLADHNVIVKRLAAVETLGETTVIFTDKTGTLTHNDLTLTRIEFPGLSGKVQWSDHKSKAEIADNQNTSEALDDDDQRVRKFLEIAVLCNDADLDERVNAREVKKDGDPLDIALLQFGTAFNSDRFRELRDYERLDEEPFDSDDMVMGTIYKIDGKLMLLCKGAPEAILERCSEELRTNDCKDLSNGKEKWAQRNEALSKDGLRAIAFAFRELEQEPGAEQDVEKDLMHNLALLGLAGFIDPPRENVQEAVDTCHMAGIQVEMITGDHPETARNIARQVNVANEQKDQTLSGGELHKEIEEHNQEEILNTHIFARVDPRQKLDLITYYRDNGAIVAMTGDGVNDAPALKKADIGIAMGDKGTQVAQGVADMILKDDAFSSIVEAIREGRVIFSNIRKFIIYQLSYHLSEILIIAVISFSIFQLPLLPLQLLFLNLLSDVFPAFALGIGRGNPNVMQQQPKDPEEPIISRRNWSEIIIYGLIIAIYIIGAYFFAFAYWDLSPEICNNIAFFSLAFAQLLHVFDMRGADEAMFKNQVTRNKYIWGAIAFCALIIISAYFIPPVNSMLSFQDLNLYAWALISATSLLPLITIQTLKELIPHEAGFNIITTS